MPQVKRRAIIDGTSWLRVSIGGRMRCGCCCCPGFLVAGLAAVGAVVVGLRGLRRLSLGGRG